MEKKREFVDFMLSAGVLTFGDFTTKSGRKTPYFINAGNYNTGSRLSTLSEYYAAAIIESGEEPDALFGPAYKGIPLVTAAAAALWRGYGLDLPWFFDRKEAKDHGEGGMIVGYRPRDGDRIAIVEDVVTAGTAVRASIELLRGVADVSVTALYVSVDRMERGQGDKSTLDELRDELGIRVYPIVTVQDIISALEERGGDNGTVDAMRGYLARYGVLPREV